MICVVGPTAVGKSAVAIEISKRCGGEVVSADSMQVYKGMDIGTAKLTTEEQAGVPHHLLDVVSPNQPCTAANWKTWADEAILGILSRGRIPVICGGTGLYIRSIVDNLNFAEQPQRLDIRQYWEKYVDTHGSEQLHKELERVDADAALRIHPNDVKRTIRALEVAEANRDRASNYDWNRRDERYRTLLIGLWMERDALYRRVEERVDTMLDMGLLDEVQSLIDSGVSTDATALQAIGYKEMVQYVDGSIQMDQAVELMKRNTRRFVKRQLSWFRRDERINWFECEEQGGFTPTDQERLWRLIDDFLEGNLCPAHE